jgi:serine/threonine protein kinase
MGQVWLAEQSAPVKRKVALKIIKAGRYDASALLRFDVERQTLAIMDHPAIAKVFDAGSTLEGQPYFVMEYVPGFPITSYCDRKHFSVRDRLALLIKVCEGVQHAQRETNVEYREKKCNIYVPPFVPRLHGSLVWISGISVNSRKNWTKRTHKQDGRCRMPPFANWAGFA